MRLKKIKDLLRPFRDFISSVLGYFYDMFRYLRYSGYRGYVKDDEKRDYKAVKIYHRLEKSLSFRDRRMGAGVRAAEDLVHLLSSRPEGSRLGFHECVGVSVLREFAKSSGMLFDVDVWTSGQEMLSSAVGGTIDISSSELRRGVLSDPEGFFFSRWTVRDYSNEVVPRDVVERAVRLAMKTPSVCNRQAWHLYYVDVREKIDACLSLQNGNAGFGHEIPGLMIITFDLKAFDGAGERNQGWIDGGMFSMSLVYALHSLGVASCCLNWSKTPGDDLRIRKIIPIKDHYNIVMMLGIGYPREKIKVCASPRKPIDSVLEYWD